MTTLQAFLLGMMVAWTPSLVIFGWCLFRTPFEDDTKRISRINRTA
jgi:hypothetical protein